MKLRRVAHFCLIAIFLLAPGFAQSQTTVNELDEKFHLEKAISERLEQTLKTRLEKNYFDITVEAKLRHRTVGISKRRIEELRAADNFQNWYTNELNVAARQNGRPYELEALNITLGLSDQVETKYRDDLKTWLQSWAKSSFGAIAESQVIIRPSDIALKNSHSLKGEETTSKWTGLGRFQNLLGMMFLGCVFLIGRYFHFRPTQKAVALSPLQTMDPVESFPEDPAQKELIRSLKTKIAWISPGIKRQIDALIASWSDKESQSYLKVAAYLEALAEGGASMPESSRAQAPVLPPHVHLSLPKALANLQELETSVQVSLYQEIYSELLAGELVEREPRHVDFDFLLDWTEKDLLEVFDSISESSQVALLARLPQSLRRRYSQVADPHKLRRILAFSLKNNESSDEELLKEVHAWQKRRANSLSAPDFAFKIAKLREAWSVFSRLEETLWLHQLVMTYPELKENLTDRSTHLAFLSDWSPDMLRKMCMMSKSKELAAVVKQLPFLSQAILGACGEGMRKEIQQEMETLTEPRTSQYFEKFVTFFDKFVESESPQHQLPAPQGPKAVA